MDSSILERLNIRLEELPVRLDLIRGTNGHSRPLRFLVTGGCGYLGFELGSALHGLGAHVTLLDLQIPEKIEKSLDNELRFIKGDVCDYESVSQASRGIDCVFHVASFGLSGKDQLDRKKNEEVNIGGTKNVIRACQENGITKLIYTSSYNVALGKQPIENGDDFIPYAPQDEMIDFYSKTKQSADKLVLAANESETRDGSKLYTCCLRPAGIYGPGERRHIHRVALMIKQGLIMFKIGDALVDWTHINNLVQAHLLVIPGLSAASNRAAAGKAYFISDGSPITVFDFLRPLFLGLGKKEPTLRCPSCLVYFVGFFMELLHWILKPIYCFEPLLTRNEVLKMTLTHYQSMSRAEIELGYRPLRYSFADVVKLYLKETHPGLYKKNSVYGEATPSSSSSSSPPAPEALLKFSNVFLIIVAVLFIVVPLFSFSVTLDLLHL